MIGVLVAAKILLVNAFLSQLILNVPLSPWTANAHEHGASTRKLMALAAGSTIAGNLFAYWLFLTVGA